MDFLDCWAVWGYFSGCMLRGDRLEAEIKKNLTGLGHFEESLKGEV